MYPLKDLNKRVLHGRSIKQDGRSKWCTQNIG